MESSLARISAMAEDEVVARAADIDSVGGGAAAIAGGAANEVVGGIVVAAGEGDSIAARPGAAAADVITGMNRRLTRQRSPAM